jgi:hypothetical protein
MKNQKSQKSRVAKRGADPRSKAKDWLHDQCDCESIIGWNDMQIAGLVGEHHPTCHLYEAPSDAERLQRQRALGGRQEVLEAENARLKAENAKLSSVDIEKETHTAVIELVLRLRGHKMSEATIRFLIEHCLDLSFDYLGETPDSFEPSPMDEVARELIKRERERQGLR